MKFNTHAQARRTQATLMNLRRRPRFHAVAEGRARLDPAHGDARRSVLPQRRCRRSRA